jgi:LysM repeat protein
MMNPAPRNHGAAVLKALIAATVLLAIIAGVPMLLAAIGAVPHTMPSPHQIARSLTGPDDTGQYFRIGGAMFVWIAWAVFTAATVKETAASIRLHGPHPSLPHNHGLRSLGPAAMVAAIAVLFTAGPAVLTVTTPHASADPAPTRPGITAPAAAPSLSPHHQAPVPTSCTTGGIGTRTSDEVSPTCVVRRYDTLWSIAAQRLPGDPAQRYKDIKKLNPGKVGQDNEIVTGTVLTLPADAHPLPATAPAGTGATRDVLVESGDTLSGIAAEHGITDWRSIWPANNGRAEPDGQHFDDADHVEPGWIVKIPHPEASAPAIVSTAPAPDVHVPARTSHASTRAAPPAHTGPAPAATAPAVPGTLNHASASAAARPDSDQHGPEGKAAHSEGLDAWDAVFAGGGVLLAAGIFIALVNFRRRQARYRRPRRTITPAPAELIPAEQALLTHGPAGIADVQFLDHAMRSLSAGMAGDPDATLPEVIAVRMAGDRLGIRLAEPHPVSLPAPWTSDESGLWWSVSVNDELPVTAANAGQYLAPYPALVTVGYDTEGGKWLLDLESAGALALIGDEDRCLDLGRFIAAELAVNAWSDQLSVTMVGFGEELVALNPTRLRYTDDLDTAVEALTGVRATALEATGNASIDVLTGRMLAVAGDSWMPHVLLIAAHIANATTTVESGKLDRLFAALQSQPERSTVAVVLAGEQITTPAVTWQASTTADGSLMIPGLGVELIAQQMPAEQVAAFGQLLAHAARLEDAPMPASTGNTPYEQFTDSAGGLLPELTLSRVGTTGSPPSAAPAVTPIFNGSGVSEQRDSTSVLPRDDEAYLGVAATNAEELEALAPRVNAAMGAEVFAADPGLDADLADWRNPESDTPKLTLLGPVQLRAHGVQPPKRVSYYTEVAAFLATRDHGATAEQVAAAFDVATTSIYSRINTVRGWLGADPATGERYLPDSTKSAAGKARGVGVYEFHNVAVDADLFKRLRARGEALGGTEGIAYLQDALNLVIGRPFDQLRPGGYGWLAETPLDHYLSAGVADVAHIVHLHHLQAGELPAARAAAETALLAAPYDEMPRLDLVAVMKAEGHDEEADRYLREEVCNRSDDGEAPLDLPERTEEILRRREWLSRAS